MLCVPSSQVRVVVERLARRLGYDAVAAAIPEEHRKLLTHIRKEKTRKLRDDKAEKVGCALCPALSGPYSALCLAPFLSCPCLLAFTAMDLVVPRSLPCPALPCPAAGSACTASAHSLSAPISLCKQANSRTVHIDGKVLLADVHVVVQ